jgi:hypothetical protein
LLFGFQEVRELPMRIILGLLSVLSFTALTISSETSYAASDLQCLLQVYKEDLYGFEWSPNTPLPYENTESDLQFASPKFPQHGCESFDSRRAWVYLLRRYIPDPHRTGYKITPRQLAQAIAHARITNAKRVLPMAGNCHDFPPSALGAIIANPNAPKRWHGHFAKDACGGR